MERPADPRRLTLRQGTQHAARLLLDIADVEVARVEHEFGGARIEPLDFERDGAEQHLVDEIDAQIQFHVSDAKLLDVGEGVIVEPGLNRREIGIRSGGGRGPAQAGEDQDRGAGA